MSSAQLRLETSHPTFNAIASSGTARDFGKTFICREESQGYAESLEQLLFARFSRHDLPVTIDEFGSGTGDPIIAAILNSGFSGTVYGYEKNTEDAAEANRKIREFGLAGQYIVHPGCFFESAPRSSKYLIANPPYIPCDEGSADRLLLPFLPIGPKRKGVRRR